MSISTTVDVMQILNDDEELDTFFLSLLYKKIPQDVKDALFNPYLSADGNQIRISFRVFESYPELKRNDLIKKINTDLVETFGLKASQVKLTGLLVLYNNVLESLFRSQILTIGVVFLAIMVMFSVLFRSLKIAFISKNCNRTITCQHWKSYLLHLNYYYIWVFNFRAVQFYTNNLLWYFYSFCHVNCSHSESNLVAVVTSRHQLR